MPIWHRRYISDAAKIYPARKWFSIGDIEFATSCHQLADRGEESLDAAFNCLRSFSRAITNGMCRKPFAIYLLDTDSSVTRTAEIMFLHKNTIKYRLRVISDGCFRPNKMPDKYSAVSGSCSQQTAQIKNKTVPASLSLWDKRARYVFMPFNDNSNKQLWNIEFIMLSKTILEVFIRQRIKSKQIKMTRVCHR